jgi:hypothetical protein
MPTPEFREACRRVLGTDDDETVVAVLTGDDHEIIRKLASAHDDIADPILPF